MDWVIQSNDHEGLDIWGQSYKRNLVLKLLDALSESIFATLLQQRL